MTAFKSANQRDSQSENSSSKVAVLKFGGEVVAQPDALDDVLRQVKRLQMQGWSFVLTHGGGPQSDELGRRLGVKTEKVAGKRVTDLATLQIAKQVLAGQVNLDVVAAAKACGLNAVGLSGVSGGLLTCRKCEPVSVADKSGAKDLKVDLGWVGDITTVRSEILMTLMLAGWTPVVSSLGVAEPEAENCGSLEIFNVNADTAAAAIAAAINADHLFLMTGIGAVFEDPNDPSSRIARLDRVGAKNAVANGVIAGGMIPKVEDALAYASGGEANAKPRIGAIHILGASGKALTDEAQWPGSSGTVLVP